MDLQQRGIHNLNGTRVFRSVFTPRPPFLPFTRPPSPLSEQQIAQEQILELLPMVTEVNAISEELDKQRTFEVVLLSAAAQEGIYGSSKTAKWAPGTRDLRKFTETFSSLWEYQLFSSSLGNGWWACVLLEAAIKAGGVDANLLSGIWWLFTGCFQYLPAFMPRLSETIVFREQTVVYSVFVLILRLNYSFERRKCSSRKCLLIF